MKHLLVGVAALSVAGCGTLNDIRNDVAVIRADISHIRDKVDAIEGAMAGGASVSTVSPNRHIVEFSWTPGGAFGLTHDTGGGSAPVLMSPHSTANYALLARCNTENVVSGAGYSLHSCSQVEANGFCSGALGPGSVAAFFSYFGGVRVTTSSRTELARVGCTLPPWQ
jgi:hypothetical protein